MKSKYNKEWDIFDPYEIFSSLDIVDLSKVEPYEDVAQFISKKNGKVIDLGYYGDYGAKNSFWGVYLINSNADWDNPESLEKFDNLLEAVKKVKILLLSC